MKKVLITGSLGFIAANFIRQAIYQKAPYKFVSLDRVSGNPNAIYTNKNHDFHIADIRDPHIIDVIFQVERPEIVLHMAAEATVDKSIIDPNPFITSNVLGTQVIIDACLKHKVEKLVYTSTDEVLGHLENENDPPWTEDASLNPRNAYSASKAAGELLVKAAHNTHGLNYIITRSCNNYGRRQTADKLIPRTIKCILNNQKIPVYGQGQQIRDWIFVDDNCSAILTLLEKGKDNQVYNISAHQEYTNLEVVQRICNAMERGHSLIEFVRDRPGHDFRYALDSRKLKELGWNPKVSFKDGIKETVQWFQDNQWMLR